MSSNLPTLHKLSDDMLKLQEMLMSGEIPEDAFNDTKEIVMADIEEKLVGYSAVDRSFDDWIESANREIARITDIKAKAQAGKNRLRKRIKDAMENCGVDKIEHVDGLVKVTLSKAPIVLNIIDIEDLPDEYYDIETKKKPKNAEIKKALQAGIDVYGAELGTGTRRLIIK